MFMIDFSRVSSAELQRFHVLIQTMSCGIGVDYTSKAIADFLDKLKYCDMLELGKNARAEFGEIYDKLHILADIDIQGLVLRNRMTAYLSANDPNGVYTDDQLMSEDYNCMTLKQAAECITNLDD